MRKVSQKGLAMSFLRERLAEGPVSSRILYAEGAEQDFSKSVMLRAAAELDITSTTIPGKYSRQTVWTLPRESV